MDNWKKRTNGWVFISHSSHDYDEVRIIRNYLEEKGFHALMFYLKCLEDKDKEDRAVELLKWEIDARDIFILCESKSATESKWVTLEKEYVNSLQNKITENINIDIMKINQSPALKKLDRLINNSTLYSIFTFEDKNIVDLILNQLGDRGFMLYKNDMTMVDTSGKIINNIKNAIQVIAKKGVVLAFISKNSKNSKWFWTEKDIALDNESYVVPIILDDISINEFPAFNNLECVRLKDYKNKQNDFVNKIISLINQRNNR